MSRDWGVDCSPDEEMTVTAAAHRLAIARTTIQRWLGAGRITKTADGLVLLSDLRLAMHYKGNGRLLGAAMPVERAALESGVSVSTIRRWVACGKVRKFGRGKVRLKEVLRCAAAHSVGRPLAGLAAAGDGRPPRQADFDTLAGCVDGGDMSAALELFEAVGEWLVADQPTSPASRRVWRAYERTAAEAGRPPREGKP